MLISPELTTDLSVETLHWLSVEHSSVFKTALLVYKYLQSGFLSGW